MFTNCLYFFLLLKELLKLGVRFPSRFRNAEAREGRHQDADDGEEVVSPVSSDVEDEIRKDFDDDEDRGASHATHNTRGETLHLQSHGFRLTKRDDYFRVDFDYF